MTAAALPRDGAVPALSGRARRPRERGGAASAPATCAFMLAALLLGLASLVEVAVGAAGLACEKPAVLACAMAPCAACGLVWARYGRGSGWVALASIGAALVALAALRADPSVQWALQQAAAAAGLWSPGQAGGPFAGLLSADPAAPDDWTAALCLAALVAGAASGALSFGAGAGGALSIAFAPPLVACPYLGYEPPLWTVGAFGAFLAVALAAGPPMRRFGAARASQLAFALAAGIVAWCVALGIAAWGGAAVSSWARSAGELARTAPAAARSAFQDAGERARGFLEGLGLEAGFMRQGGGSGSDVTEGQGGQAEAPSAQLSGGEVSRTAQDPGTGEALEAVAGSRPENVVYLAFFHGGAYLSGRWEAADDAASPAPEDSSEAELEAAKGLLGGAAREVSLALLAVSGGVDPASLGPYLAVRTGAGAYDLLDAGAYLSSTSMPAGLLRRAGEASEAGSGSGYYAWACEEYTRAPREELPRLAALVEENPVQSADEAVRTVLRLLDEGMEYTADISPIPDGAEVAEYSLFESHEGYCQHFATAAALMLRLYGVPARYATGLAVPASAFEPQEDGSWRAEAGYASAHAWVEVLLPGAGWVPVEATPPSSGAAPWAGGGEVAAGEGAGEEQGDGGAQGGSVGAAQAGLAQGTGGQADESAAASPAGAGADGDELAAGAGRGAEGEGGLVGTGETVSEEGGSSTSGEEPSEPSAGGAQGSGGDGAEAASGPEAGHATSPAARRALVGAAAAALMALAAFAARLAVLGRREKALAARAAAPADSVLADMLELLHEAGLLEGLNGTEAGFASELARAVPAIGAEEAERLVGEALEAAFGPGREGPGGGASGRPAADPRTARDYGLAVEAALPRMSRRARLRAKYVRCLA